MPPHILDSLTPIFFRVLFFPEAVDVVLTGVFICEKPPDFRGVGDQKDI